LIPTTAASDGELWEEYLKTFFSLNAFCSCIWQFGEIAKRVLPFWISTVNRELARVFAFGFGVSFER